VAVGVQQRDYLQANPVVGAEFQQHPRGHAVAIEDQAEQDVAGADGVVMVRPGFFLRLDNGQTRPVGELFKHGPGRPSRSFSGAAGSRRPGPRAWRARV
jgi:hypothetical protein